MMMVRIGAPVASSCFRLSIRRRQRLGIGEGVETTLAGMRISVFRAGLPAAPKGLRDFGDFLKSSGGMIARSGHPVVKLSGS